MLSVLKNIGWCCIAAFATAQAATPTTNGDIQSLDAIQSAAEQQIRQIAPPSAGKLFLAADKLDARLRLKECGVPLSAFLPSGANLGARATVGVRCTQGAQWTVYVPVSIETETQVLVLRSAAGKDAQLGPAEVEIQSRRIHGLGSAYLSDPAQLKQQHLKRALPAGSVLVPEALAPNFLVKRGQQVVLLATVGGIEVRANGVALTDGAAASRVRVQNLSSLKVVEGTVDTENVVRVQL